MVRIIGPEHCLISSAGVISSDQTAGGAAQLSSFFVTPAAAAAVVVLWCCQPATTAHHSTAAAAVEKFNRNSTFIGNTLLHPAAAGMAGVSAQYRIGRVYYLSTAY